MMNVGIDRKPCENVQAIEVIVGRCISSCELMLAMYTCYAYSVSMYVPVFYVYHSFIPAQLRQLPERSQ